MKQLRGGNAAIYRNGDFLTDSSSGCLRIAKLRSNEFQAAVDDPRTMKVFKIGHMFEDWFETQSKTPLKKEEQVRFEINKNVEFIGHIDYMDDDFLYELKSVTSKNTFREVFKKNKPKMQNVLQLATYMVALERDKAKLIYGSFVKTVTYDQLDELGDDEFEEMCDTLKPDQTIEFNIHMCEDGHFYCNNVEIGLHILDITEFWNEAASILIDEEVPPKPEKLDAKSFFGPCDYCQLKDICASEYDSWDQFYLTVKNSIAARQI